MVGFREFILQQTETHVSEVWIRLRVCLRQQNPQIVRVSTVNRLGTAPGEDSAAVTEEREGPRRKIAILSC